MLNNDLSNYTKETIGFFVYGTLLKKKNSNKITHFFNEKILNNKLNNYELDKRVSYLVEFLFRRTEYNCDLILYKKDYSDDLRDLLDYNCLHNRIVLIDSLSDVTSRLLIGDITLCVCDDEEQRSLINNKYAIPLEDLNNYINIRRVGK